MTPSTSRLCNAPSPSACPTQPPKREIVEGCLEDIGIAELGSDFDVVLGDFHCQIAGFQHIHATEQHHGLVVGDLDFTYANDFLLHFFLP
jgi:hypothetical protein